tara:strand:- start:19111 stop:19332 length:222 start_codon:yes stop_codon:yes gene_type:complete
MIVIGYQKAGFEDEIIDVVFEEHEDRDDAEDALNRLVLTQDTIEDTLLHYFWAIKHETGYKIMAIKDKTVGEE